MPTSIHIKVHVTAKAAQEKIERREDNLFLISVRAKAEHNAANERVLELLREYYGGKACRLYLVGGHHSPHKLVSVSFE